ncbi:ribonuclease HII [Lacicoccus alkaliphilus]|uniref:Ribonuclease HII n=1 Tax=Lacicoccus alkaliphilus DSM 16010 TaxID=1123231 RepID=A0A1M7C7F2_9BACL|nr:ribonuclease HII [Salinicoccus alkaliphilus]SHL63151.1 RNase HII [Salinicoccus alkaliphilus DSM 16010]
MTTVNETVKAIKAIQTLEALAVCPHHDDSRAGVKKALLQHRSHLEKQVVLIKKYEEMSRYENSLEGHIAGVDEAGRGPIAGEVVAAAVILPDGFMLPGLDDSKKLSLKKRLAFRETIMQVAYYGIGIASVEEIDMLNIYQASRLAMKRAVAGLGERPGHLLVDAMTIDAGIPETSIIKGDAHSVSIAAASIIAKTERDMRMEAHDMKYPGYNFSAHKGYGTKEHLEALETLGPCEIHRRTFEPVRTISQGRPEMS